MKKFGFGSRFPVVAVWVLVLYILLFPGQPRAESQADWFIKPAAQLGGWRNDMVVSDDIAAVAEGLGVTFYRIASGTFQKTAVLALPVEPTAITIQGTKLYAVSGSWWDPGLFIVADISDPLNPEVLGTCEADSSGGSMEAYGSRVYFSSGGWLNVVRVVDVTDPSNPVFKGDVDFGESVTPDVFTIHNNLMYVQGRHFQAGLFFVYDLTGDDPLAPVRKGQLAVGTGERSGGLCVAGNLVYSALGHSGVRVVNVSDPASPSPRALITVSDSEKTYSVKDVFVEGSLLYLASDNGGVFVFDVSDLDNPVDKGRISLDKAFVVDGSDKAVAVLSGGDTAFHVIGFTDDTPAVTASASTPEMTSQVLADGNTLYMGGHSANNETALWIYNSSSASNPVLVSRNETWNNIHPVAIHDGHLIALYNSTADDTQLDSLVVVDVTDPQNPSEKAVVFVREGIHGAAVSGTIACLLNKNDGGHVLDISNPAAPVKRADLPFSGKGRDIAVSGYLVGIARETGGENKVDIFDITSPESPVLKSTLSSPGNWANLQFLGATLFVVSNTQDDTSTIEVYDLSNPAAPVKKGALVTEKEANDIQVLATGDEDLIVLLAKPGGSVHTYGYDAGTGTLYSGEVCPSPYSIQVTVSPTPNRDGGYTVTTTDSSYGTYIQEITRTPTVCCLTTDVMPAEAAQDGCTASPVRADPVDCNSQVDVTASPVTPWVFKEWTGAASGTVQNTQAQVTAKCSNATAHFWRPELRLSPGGGNPDPYATFYGIAGQFDYDNGATDVPIIHITLTANEVDDWQVTGLTFQTEGTGNEKEDVAEARLYLGSVGGKVLGKKTFTADNGGIGFSFNEVIPKNESRDFMLVYDVKPERAWPCNDYKAFINISGVGATPVNYPPGVKLPPLPYQVDGGPSTVKMGDLVIVEGDRQYGEAESPEAENNPLEKPLKVRLAWQHPASVNHVTYAIISPLANGGFLAGVPGTRNVEKQVDAEGYTEETLTLGTKKGKQNPYEVQMGMDVKGATCYSSWAPPVFMAWGMGLDMAAESQYDNPDNGELFGTFLSNVQAENTFTLTIDMAPEDYAEVREVLFAMGGQSQTGEEVTKNKKYTAEFDMQSFKEPQKLLITVKMLKDGSTVEQTAEYDVKAIKLPSWVDAVYKISHEESFTREFSEEDGGTYNFAFNYPTNFAWSDVVPGDIGMLGGLDNDLDIEFTAEAAYRVNETSTFGATVSGEPTILGQSFSLEGGLSGDFDPDFAFQRGNGSLRAGFEFDLPKKGYAKTILVYGVPITVAVDLSGNVEIFVQGSAVLNRELEFERVTVAPGTTVTGHITISLSAVFGLAKLAATGSPTATVEIELTYTTDSGTETTWQGEVSVPISVVGSIFWGVGSAELYSGELGPWQFGSGGRAPAAFRPLGEVSGPDAPDFISASALAIDPDGRQMQVWTADTGKSEGPDPDVFYRFYDTTAWSDSVPIIGAQNSPDEFWETDPAVVFMKNGTALAAWTSNKGDKSLGTLWDILSHQDIAYAVWNGATWSSPELLTNDLTPDGVVDLTYDAGNDSVMAVWVHDSHDHGQDGENGNDDGKMTRTGWTLKYGIFHNGVWSLPDQVPGTGEGSADFMPSVAADGNGSVLLVWARDGDGEFFTKLDAVQGGTNVDSGNTDSDIYWSRWNGTEWQTPAPLTETNAATALFPSVAFGSGGRAVAVWVEKSGTLEKLMYRIYENAAWKDTGMVHESTLPVEEPAVAIDGNGRITLVWRGHANGRSNLFMSRADIDTLEWSDPEPVTGDDHVDWNVSMAMAPDGRPVISWTKYDPATGETSSSSGLRDGANIGRPAPGTADFTGTFQDAAVDEDNDQLYDHVAFSADVTVHSAGTYQLSADLIGPWKLATVSSSPLDLEPGDHTIVIQIPGGIFSDVGYDGIYQLKNISLLDMTDTPMMTAFTSTPHETEVYTASDFVPGPLTLDKTVYQGLTDTAKVTLNAPEANLDPSAKDTVPVKVATTLNPKGMVVLLTETGPDTALFTGVFGFNLTASDPTAATIHVSDNSSVQVFHHDKSLDYHWMASAKWITFAVTGDLDADGSAGLPDANTALQILTRQPADVSPEYLNSELSPSGNPAVSLEDIPYMLQKQSDLRP